MSAYISARASLPTRSKPVLTAVRAKSHIEPTRVIPKQSWIDRKMYGYGHTNKLYIPSLPIEFSSDDGNPTLRVAVCHAQEDNCRSPAAIGSFCDVALGHTIDIFDDINVADITSDNVIETLDAVLERVKTDFLATGEGNTSAAVFSKTLLLVLETALYISHDEVLSPDVTAMVMEIISRMVFSDHEEEKTIRGQWRALAARATDIKEVCVCHNMQDLTMPLLVQFYEAWARAPAFLGMRASQRSYHFMLMETNDLLCPHHWGTRSALPTTQQAGRLLVAMAKVMVQYEDTPSVFALRFLYPCIQMGVDELTITELEAVAAAAEKFPWPGQVVSVYPVNMLHAAAKEAVRREAFGLEDSALCGAVMSVAVHSAHCGGLGWEGDALRNAIEGWKVEYNAEARAEEAIRKAAVKKSSLAGRFRLMRAIGAALVGTIAGFLAPGPDA